MSHFNCEYVFSDSINRLLNKCVLFALAARWSLNRHHNSKNETTQHFDPSLFAHIMTEHILSDLGDTQKYQFNKLATGFWCFQDRCKKKNVTVLGAKATRLLIRKVTLPLARGWE